MTNEEKKFLAVLRRFRNALDAFSGVVEEILKETHDLKVTLQPKKRRRSAKQIELDKLNEYYKRRGII